MPVGRIAAKAGAELGKQVVEGAASRRRKVDTRAAAELQAATAYQTARQTLIETIGRTDPEHRGELFAQLNALDAEERYKINKAAKAERGKTFRRTAAVATVLGVLAAGAVAGVRGLDAVTDAVKGTVVPEVTVTTEQRLGSALTSVEQRADKIIATGSGDGEATVSTRVNVGMFGVDLRLPGGLVGSEARVKVRRNLDIVSRAGAVTLKPMQDQADGSWDVLALVNPAKITPQVSGNQPPAPESGATSGFFNDIGHALGFNEGEQAQLYQNAESMAVRSFEASASRIMTETKTLAALQANVIRQGIQELGGATPPGEVHDALAQLATADIHVAFVNVDQNSGQMSFIDPSEPTAVQAYMSLPKPPAPSVIKVSAVEISMTTPEQLLMSTETRNNLDAIEDRPGYTLVTNPSLLEPYAVMQAPN